MLPAAARLTRNREFRLVVRRGRRAGRARLVVHVLTPYRAEAGSSALSRSGAGAGDAPGPARVGFIVSKAVGCAVTRHRVARRLRHLMRERITALPAGTLVVVRALPPAATASSQDLGTDLDAALRKLRMPVPRDGPSQTDLA